MKSIVKLIEVLIKKHLKRSFVVGKVISVDAKAKTCIVQPDDEPKIFDVRLTAIEDDHQTSVLITPKTGSYVTIGLLNDEQESFITKYSEIKKIELSASDQIIFNDGDSTTLKGQDTVEQLNKMSARIDMIIDAISNAKPVPQDGGTAYQTAMVGMLSALEEEDFSQIENEKVLHG